MHKNMCEVKINLLFITSMSYFTKPLFYASQSSVTSAIEINCI